MSHHKKPEDSHKANEKSGSGSSLAKPGHAKGGSKSGSASRKSKKKSKSKSGHHRDDRKVNDNDPDDDFEYSEDNDYGITELMRREAQGACSSAGDFILVQTR